MNKLVGMVCTTLGGGMIGAGIQRTQMLGNKIANAFSKNKLNFDEGTWSLLIIGLLVLACGVYFSRKK